MRNILVTGGVGFIGTNFCLLAASKGHKITILDNLSRKGVEKNLPIIKKLKAVTFKKFDLRKPIPTSVGKFDAIVHLASSCSTPKSLEYPMDDFLDNALSTLNVLEYARLNGKIPVIYGSTCKVYTTEINKLKTKKFNEFSPTEAKGIYSRAPYGCSKYTGDIYCQEYFTTYGVPTVINRMSAVFGKYQRGSPESGFLYWFIKAKKFGLPIEIYGNGNQVRDMVWGEDIAELFMEQLENINKHKGQIYNIGGGFKNAISLNQAVKYLNNKGGKPLEIKKLPTRPADLEVYISDLTKITKNSNWIPKTSVYDGIDMLMDEKDL
ncbi:MAG: CDP-paratose 2-epimerase [Candidatus Daviesbacteria bacterium GW2011_GWA1_36_8]|uniref:CDP-paratose 2-epimerase n=1 Tax=Candidatus Daviesbacteria bacterium GW2011_GWA1_36_8 TaxID=1618417 RepID=A0A0G0F398_9BACT|nr:MAG: CDP-paratose 2-epimerase [Candidatus Daviesbacteria bacterium GW2011_GWA1_36_8]